MAIMILTIIIIIIISIIITIIIVAIYYYLSRFCINQSLFTIILHCVINYHHIFLIIIYQNLLLYIRLYYNQLSIIFAGWLLLHNFLLSATVHNLLSTIYHHNLLCEQIDPCSGLSLLSVVPVMLIAPGDLSAWHADSVLIFLAQDLSQYHWRSMHDCTHVHHVQLHCYLVPLRILLS